MQNVRQANVSKSKNIFGNVCRNSHLIVLLKEDGKSSTFNLVKIVIRRINQVVSSFIL